MRSRPGVWQFAAAAAILVAAAATIAGLWQQHTRDASAVSGLSALVDRSFVSFERSSRGGRYRLHETMREFTLLRLIEAGEESNARRAHRTYFADMCRRSDFDGRGADNSAKLEALHAELIDSLAASSGSARFRRTLAGAVVTRAGDRLSVEVMVAA